MSPSAYTSTHRSSLSWKWFVLAAAVFAAQAVPRLWTDSLVNDEAWEITNGYCFLTQGETRNGSNYIHPPFLPALHALPLLALPLKAPPPNLDGENRAYVFFYLQNPEWLSAMTLWPRVISLLFSLGIGWFLFRATGGDSPAVGLMVLTLWAFEPNLLGWGTIAKTDSGATFMALAAVGAFSRALRNPTSRNSILAGVLLGGALASKLTLLFLPFSLLAVDFLKRGSTTDRMGRWIRISLGVALFIHLLYAPAIFQTGNLLAPCRDYGRELLDLAALAQRPSPWYFMSDIHASAPLWAFPVVFLVKNTFAILLLFALAAFWGATRRIRPDPEHALPGIVLLLTMFLTRSVTYRYALPALALLLPTAARALGYLASRPREPLVGRFLIVCFLLAHATSSLAHLERPISYLNELVPNARKLRLLGNYNFDVGQDFKRLAREARLRGWTSLKLADTTMVEPCVYGVPWKSWTQKDLEGPQPGQCYVWGASFLQFPETAYPETALLAQGWPSRTPPTGWIGDTLVYWEAGGVPRNDPSPLLHSRPYFKSPISVCDRTRLAP
jgi:hypothetical protein